MGYPKAIAITIGYLVVAAILMCLFPVCIIFWALSTIILGIPNQVWKIKTGNRYSDTDWYCNVQAFFHEWFDIYFS